MLSPNNLTEILVDQYVQNKGNSIGIFERKDLRKFQAWGKETNSKWTFMFVPSRVDTRVGLIKVIPTNEKAEGIMFRGHVRDLKQTFKWLPDHKARKLVELLVDNESLRFPITRNTVIKAAKHQIIRDHVKREAVDGESDVILNALLLQTRSIHKSYHPSKLKRELSIFRLLWEPVVEILDQSNKPQTKAIKPKSAKGFDSVKTTGEIPAIGLIEVDQVEVDLVEVEETMLEEPGLQTTDVELEGSNVDEQLREELGKLGISEVD